MGWLSFLKKTPPEEKTMAPVEFEGYSIEPVVHEEQGKYYTAGRISKSFDSGVKSQSFIRADTHTSRESAAEHSVQKAKQIIREQGDKLFRDE